MRRVRLTSAGRAFHAYAERLLALRREAEARVRAGEGLEAGELRVAASTIPGEYLLPGWLARFRELHPAVAIAVRVADSDEAIDDVRAGRADLGAVGKRARDPRLLFTPLGEDEILLVAAPSLRVRRAEPDDLRRLPLVARERGSGTRDAVATLLAPIACRSRICASRSNSAAPRRSSAPSSPAGCAFLAPRRGRGPARATPGRGRDEGFPATPLLLGAATRRVALSGRPTTH